MIYLFGFIHTGKTGMYKPKQLPKGLRAYETITSRTGQWVESLIVQRERVCAEAHFHFAAH